MQLHKKVNRGINRQIQVEQQASQFYLGMSSYFEKEGFEGYASWMRKQSEEERQHALKLLDYLQDRDGELSLGELKAPDTSFSSPLAALREALKNEQEVSEQIRKLYREADSSQDEATAVFLHWYLTEQVEEEKGFRDEVERLELAGDNPAALLLLDSQAAGRE